MPLRVPLAGASMVAAGFSAAAVTSSFHWWVAPGLLLMGLLLMQFFEVMTCYSRQAKSVRQDYDWNHVLLKKVYTWFLWVCTLVLDMIAHLIPNFFTDLHFPLLQQPTFLPFSLTFTLLATMGEMTRTAVNIKAFQGQDSDADMVVGMLRMITFVNRQRWFNSGRLGELPSRWTDGLTKEQVLEVQMYLQGKGAIPAWLQQMVPGEVPTPEAVQATPPDLKEAIPSPPSTG